MPRQFWSQRALFLPIAYILYTSSAVAALTPEQVGQNLESHLDSRTEQIHACIVQDNPSLSGQKMSIDMTTVIQQTGKVESVVDHAHVVPSAAFEKCVAAPLKARSFGSLGESWSSVELATKMNFEVKTFRNPVANGSTLGLLSTLSYKDRPKDRKEETALLMSEEIPQLYSCYRDYLTKLSRAEQKKAQGKMLVKMTFDQQGKQIGARLAKSPFKDQKVNDCIMEKISSLRLSPTKSSAQKIFQVNYPIRFTNLETKNEKTVK